MRKNSLHCIVWATDEINRLIDLVDKTELWYETAQFNPDEIEEEAIDFCRGGGESLLNVEEVRNMSMAQELSTFEASNAESQLILSMKILRALQIRCLRKSPWREIFTWKRKGCTCIERSKTVH